MEIETFFGVDHVFYVEIDGKHIELEWNTNVRVAKYGDNGEPNEEDPDLVLIYKNKGNTKESIFCTPIFENMYFDDLDTLLDSIENEYGEIL